MSQEGVVLTSPLAALPVSVTLSPGEPVCLGQTRSLVNGLLSANKTYGPASYETCPVTALAPSLCHHQQEGLQSSPL